MNKCKYCGSILYEVDNFCGNCGKPVPEKSLFTSSHNSADTLRKGILMTDSVRLAQLLKVSRSAILSALQNYIESTRSSISYSLLDTANEKLADNWRAYHRLLFKNKYLSFQFQPEYLFIIGGEDIIPVPSIKNCMVKTKELVPTDILYGYNLSFFSSDEEDVNSIINSKQLYYVGRLPLGHNMTFDQLQCYFERAASYMDKGIPVQIAYAQCDPHWKKASMEVMSDLDRCNMLPDIQAPSSIMHKKIFLSPYVTCETIDKAFNSYSNLFYFNMHGSSNPDTPYFIGKSLEDESSYAGIGPETISEAKYDNIIVTEACYGGKYIDLETNKSMLLTAICNTTMLYLGSSVVAYGVVDNNLKKDNDIFSADVMAKVFITSLMDGYTAGESVFTARRKLFNSKPSGHKLSDLLTIYEFSLYGDPALKALFPNQKSSSPLSHDSLSDGFANMALHIEDVYSEQPASVLSIIRQKVDQNLQSLNEDIQKYLTECGISPRQLTNISKVNFGTCSQHLFLYKTDSGEEPIVVVDDHDHSKTLLMPKGNADQGFNDARSLSINYASIFQSYCDRFGLISTDDVEQPVLTGNGQVKTVYIDKRIEPKSKRQIKTFNAVLDLVYRPKMQQNNIASLSTKECDYDFSLLINPLAILLETELRLGLIPLIKKQGTALPSEPTFGRMVDCFMQNTQLLMKYGINGDFLSLISDIPNYRNPASHGGGINESRFLKFYDLFIKIVSSSNFSKVLELKQNYK